MAQTHARVSETYKNIRGPPVMWVPLALVVHFVQIKQSIHIQPAWLSQAASQLCVKCFSRCCKKILHH